MAAVTPDGAQLLTVRESAVENDWGLLAVSEAWILEEQVLRPELGDATLQHLGFLHDHDEAAAGVANGALQMAFFMKPFPMDAFEESSARDSGCHANQRSSIPNCPLDW